MDARGTGVERVGDGFGEDPFLECAYVCVPKVFEQMLEVDAGFAHIGILSRRRNLRLRSEAATVHERLAPLMPYGIVSGMASRLPSASLMTTSAPSSLACN